MRSTPATAFFRKPILIRTLHAIAIMAKKICTCDKLYRVQIGAFENRDNADRMLSIVVEDGFPGFIIYDGGLYKVQVGAFRELDNAVRMERRLRRYRYNTFITE